MSKSAYQAYESHEFWKVREQVSVFYDLIGYEAANTLAHVVLGDDNYEDTFVNAALECLETHGYPLPEHVTFEQYKATVGFLKYLLTIPESWRERPELEDE